MQEHAGEEGEAHPDAALPEVLSHVAGVQAAGLEGQEAQGDQTGQGQADQPPGAQEPEDRHIDQVDRQLEEQRPGGRIEGEGARIGEAAMQGRQQQQPAPEDRPGLSRREDRQVQLQGQQAPGRADGHAQSQQGIEPDQTRLDEVPGAHPARKLALIGVGDDEAAQHEEEVDRQVAVGQPALQAEPDMAVHHHDAQGGHAAQPVQGGVVGGLAHRLRGAWFRL